MKLQHLAVIFIIIILPITLVLSSYIQTHINSIQSESQYTTRLMSATHDAALSFQLNTANNGYSTTQDSKMRDVEASISTFYNSLSLAMGSDGYTKEELQLYTPAILCTLYDGYYIYTKYNDIKFKNEALTEDNYTYGLKPFITYSCRYKNEKNYDFVVNYTLDNTITIIGTVNGEYVTKSGHLIYLPEGLPNDLNNINDLDKYIVSKINNLLKDNEVLKESLVTLSEDGNYEYEEEGTNHAHVFKYVIYNSQKFYIDDDGSNYFWYGSDYRKNFVSSEDLKNTLKNLFENNKQGLNYYREAVTFSKWVNDNLGNIEQSHCVDLDNNKLFNSDENYTEIKGSIFKTSETNNPLLSDSIFNEHRMNVIKNSITTNLKIVMNTFGTINSNEFSMPIISEAEWYNIENNVTFVSFLQGLPMKSKTYNNYCVVSNNTNKETASDDSIYIIDSNGNYHKPGCKTLIGNLISGAVSINGAYSASDFERKSILITGSDVSAWTNAEDISAFFYPQTYTACYDCIVNAANLNSVDEIIKDNGNLSYLDSSGNYNNIEVSKNDNLEKYRNIYLRALARERYNLYTINGYFGN